MIYLSEPYLALTRPQDKPNANFRLRVQVSRDSEALRACDRWPRPARSIGSRISSVSVYAHVVLFIRFHRSQARDATQTRVTTRPEL